MSDWLDEAKGQITGNYPGWEKKTTEIETETTNPDGSKSYTHGTASSWERSDEDENRDDSEEDDSAG